MTSRDRDEYVKSKAEFSSIITNVAPRANVAIRSLALIRTETYLNLMGQWMRLYSTQVPNMAKLVGADNLTTKLALAVHEYLNAYRIFHRLPNNITYTKIISFEIHYMMKHDVLKPMKEGDEARIIGDETGHALLVRSPLLHWMQYRIARDFQVYHLRSAQQPSAEEARLVVTKMARMVLNDLSRFSMSKWSKATHKMDFRDFVEASPGIKSVLDKISASPL